jgi:death-on-curing protein
LKFDPADAVRIMEMVAAGARDELALAEWFRQRIAE